MDYDDPKNTLLDLWLIDRLEEKTGVSKTERVTLRLTPETVKLLVLIAGVVGMTKTACAEDILERSVKHLLVKCVSEGLIDLGEKEKTD